MEVYDNEEQQIEAIKHWWSENGTTVAVGLVLGLGGIFGWRYYQDSQLEAKADASDAYIEVTEALQAKGLDAADDIQKFIDENKSSNYASLAAMQLARTQVSENKLDDAMSQLELAKANTKDEALLVIIDYRQARILAAQKKYDEAIAKLDSIKDEAWKGRVLELKGDVALQKGDLDAARSAYTSAQQAAPQNQNLGFKLDDLAKEEDATK